MRMATPRKPAKAAKPEQRNPFTSIRVRDVFTAALRKACERNGTTMSEEVNTAVRERLEKLGLWPLQ